MRKTDEGTTQIALRVANDAIRRAELLRSKLLRDPALAASGRVTKSTVLKVALMRGLEVLEREYK